MSASEDIVTITISGRPIPLQRHRTGNGRTYLPARSKAYREAVQAEWLAGGRPSLGSASFAMSARFYGARANADLDNLCKAILDALNTLAYADDAQLVCLSGCHKLPVDADGARAVIELWPADRQAA
jgi:crossover junction endodeoxyribonuclease RusA